MSAEGLHLYFKIVAVFNLQNLKFIYYAVFGWGEYILTILEEIVGRVDLYGLLKMYNWRFPWKTIFFLSPKNYYFVNWGEHEYYYFSLFFSLYYSFFKKAKFDDFFQSSSDVYLQKKKGIDESHIF